MKDSEEVKKRKRNSYEGKETEKSKKMKESRTFLAPTSTGRERFYQRSFKVNEEPRIFLGSSSPGG